MFLITYKVQGAGNVVTWVKLPPVTPASHILSAWDQVLPPFLIQFPANVHLGRQQQMMAWAPATQVEDPDGILGP